jgi:hypothetical protein
MARAQFQLENSLSAMGTVYSQVLMLRVKDVDSVQAQRLQEDIDGQVILLQDITAAMDEGILPRIVGERGDSETYSLTGRSFLI